MKPLTPTQLKLLAFRGDGAWFPAKAGRQKSMLGELKQRGLVEEADDGTWRVVAWVVQLLDAATTVDVGGEGHRCANCGGRGKVKRMTCPVCWGVGRV